MNPAVPLKAPTFLSISILGYLFALNPQNRAKIHGIERSPTSLYSHHICALVVNNLEFLPENCAPIFISYAFTIIYILSDHEKIEDLAYIFSTVNLD